MDNRRGVLLCLVAAIVALAGCSNATSQPHAPEGTAEAGGVCYLVTDAEVESLAGRAPIGGGSGFELGGQRFCNWIMNLDPPIQAGIVLSRAENFENDRLGSTDQVPGVGEDAYWIADVSGLVARSGAYSLYVSVDTPDRDEKGIAVAIATKALTRLR